MRSQLWQYQAKAEPVAEHESIIPPFDWFVQPPAFTGQQEPLVQEGFKVEPLEPIVVAIPDFGWFVQEPDVIRPPHQVRPGFFVLGAVPIEISNFDWISETGIILGQKHYQYQAMAAPLINFDLLRFDPIAAETTVIFPARRYQYQAKAEPVFVPPPDFDWFVPPPDVIRPLPQRQGFYTLVEDFVVVVEQPFIQPSDIFPAPEIREGLFVRGRDGTEFFPPVDWMPVQADVIRPLDQEFGYYILVEDFVAVIVNFDWWVQHENPMLPLRTLLGEEAKPILTLAALPGEVIFIIQECLALDQLEQNRILPLPSAFTRSVAPPAPSAWVQEGKPTLWDDLNQ